MIPINPNIKAHKDQIETAFQWSEKFNPFDI